MLDERIAIRVRHLVAMTMALTYLRRSVDLRSARPRSKSAGVRTETHCPAHVGEMLLRFHQRYHGVPTFWCELARVRVVEADHVPRELDDCALHPEAYAEERKSGLAGVANGFEHP